MSQGVLTGTGYIIHIKTLRQLTPVESSIPLILKRTKEFDEHTKKKYGKIMNITKDQSSSINMYPEHND